MTTRNLLVELFVEELPPKALKKLGDAFAAALADGLRAQGLADAGGAVTAFASPRRLAAHVPGVRAQAADRHVAHKLMPVAVGLDAAGRATPALLKKLAAIGADESVLPALRRAPDGKNEALFHDASLPGAQLAAGLQQALADAIAKLPIPKVMRYQLADGWTSVDFVRPAHRLVALHGDDVIPVQALGLTADRLTEGHRFEATQCPITLRDADSYAAQLRDDGAVIAGFAERRAEVVRQLDAAAVAQGLEPIDDAALVDEVTALVERPNVLVCRFDAEFLAVPSECLILTMKANQKYFPLQDAAGALTDRFLVVSNLSPADPGRIVEGNERVVRPRLADAKFFFDTDRKKTLESRVAGLAKVVYHHRLGTQAERAERVRRIAHAVCEQLGDPELQAAADSAARLAKADLLTDMVAEFPELQGTMGGYYARHDGLSDRIAEAIEDHYKPRFAGDALPRNAVGRVVALADKLETLVGLFGIGQAPSGDRDPFALRRHALGVVRLLSEAPARADGADLRQLALPALLDAAVAVFGGALADDPRRALRDFVADRLAAASRERGYSAQEVDAVLALGLASRLDSVPERLAAVRAFAALPEAPALAAANKRVANILRKSGAAAAAVPARVDAALLHEPAEARLADALAGVQPAADAAFDRGDYTASLRALAALKSAVDAFFDAVMVNADDPALRANRLGLLAQLHAAMNRVADLSKLAA